MPVANIVANLTDIASIIKENNNFLIATHISPDSDAHGSSGGLYLILKKLAKNVSIYLPDRLGARYSSLCEDLEFIHSVPEATFVLISVDTATKERLGDEHENLCSKSSQSINIDHHTSNPNWANINYVDANSPATACIIYKLAIELGIELDSKVSNLLYAGILDDTGSFRYSNTTEECLFIASKLVSAGAKPNIISNSLHFEVPERVMRLRARAFENLRLSQSGQVSLIYVDNKLLNELNCTAEDSEGLVDLVRSIQGVKLAFFIREYQDKWKVSCRTKDDVFDVNVLARKFGGGGHKAASGFTFKGTLEEVIKTVETSAAEMLN